MHNFLLRARAKAKHCTFFYFLTLFFTILLKKFTDWIAPMDFIIGNSEAIRAVDSIQTNSYHKAKETGATFITWKWTANKLGEAKNVWLLTIGRDMTAYTQPLAPVLQKNKTSLQNHAIRDKSTKQTLYQGKVVQEVSTLDTEGII